MLCFFLFKTERVVVPAACKRGNEMQVNSPLILKGWALSFLSDPILVICCEFFFFLFNFYYSFNLFGGCVCCFSFYFLFIFSLCGSWHYVFLFVAFDL